jgi:hypothetical protein
LAPGSQRDRPVGRALRFELELTSPEQRVGFTGCFEYLRDRSAAWMVVSPIADPSEVPREGCTMLLVPEKRLALAADRH